MIYSLYSCNPYNNPCPIYNFARTAISGSAVSPVFRIKLSAGDTLMYLRKKERKKDEEEVEVEGK